MLTLTKIYLLWRSIFYYLYLNKFISIYFHWRKHPFEGLVNSKCKSSTRLHKFNIELTITLNFFFCYLYFVGIQINFIHFHIRFRVLQGFYKHVEYHKYWILTFSIVFFLHQFINMVNSIRRSLSGEDD